MSIYKRTVIIDDKGNVLLKDKNNLLNITARRNDGSGRLDVAKMQFINESPIKMSPFTLLTDVLSIIALYHNSCEQQKTQSIIKNLENEFEKDKITRLQLSFNGLDEIFKKIQASKLIPEENDDYRSKLNTYIDQVKLYGVEYYLGKLTTEITNANKLEKENIKDKIKKQHHLRHLREHIIKGYLDMIYICLTYYVFASRTLISLYKCANNDYNSQKDYEGIDDYIITIKSRIYEILHKREEYESQFWKRYYDPKESQLTTVKAYINNNHNNLLEETRPIRIELPDKTVICEVTDAN